MTKELQKEGDKEILGINKKIDSLTAVLNNTIIENQKNDLINQIINQKNYLETYKLNYIQENSKEIWIRINRYAKDYAVSHQLELILGSQFNGDIIYGNPENEETEEIIQFINRKYEGL